MTTKIELLPLPEGEASSFGSYNVHDDEAMIEYARANVARNTALLRAEIEALRAERDALAKDAAKYRWGINNARWIRSEHAAYVAIPVAPDADLSCVAVRDAAIDEAMEKENSNEGKSVYLRLVPCAGGRDEMGASSCRPVPERLPPVQQPDG